jgi:alanine-glyoxylate transaminase/(R)-3-amino-2-methylpropionate-pyruvate transaminase
VVTTPEIAAVMKDRIHFNTFGANPMCSAGGRAVLKTLIEDGYQANCATVGTQTSPHSCALHLCVTGAGGDAMFVMCVCQVGAHLLERLGALAEKHSIIGDVRGKGLMLGVELVKDRATKEPAAAELSVIMERMKDMGVLMGKGGLHGNVFRIKPPMCFSKDDADFLVDVMDVAMSEL